MNFALAGHVGYCPAAGPKYGKRSENAKKVSEEDAQTVTDEVTNAPSDGEMMFTDEKKVSTTNLIRCGYCSGNGQCISPPRRAVCRPGLWSRLTNW